MRIAELVNHQIVERKLHFLIREVFLFECVLTSLAFMYYLLLISTKQLLRLILILFFIEQTKSVP